MQIRRIEAILQTKFLIEESNVESLLSTVPIVKLDATDTNNEEKKECVAEDEVDLVFKNEGSDDDLSSDDDDNTEG